MIAFLTGRLAAKTTTHALIDVGGVGYKLAMPTPALASLPAEGDEVTVYTYLHVREDDLSLFGFESDDSRGLFEQLITVSGVGPKVAISVLSALSPDALKRALATDDVALLSSVPGIGKKTAQRLIIELKDKLDLPDLSLSGGGVSAAAASAARDALLSMGFSPGEASAALADGPADATAEQLLKRALKSLGGGR
jgi:Holliday junction DNA helicase RuvA